MFRVAVLVAALIAFGVAGYGYAMAVRRTSDPNRAGHIAFWGGWARAHAWTPETSSYRTMMRLGSPIGLLLFLIWEYLGAR